MEYIEREAALAQTHEINITEVGYRHRCIDPQAIREIPAADVAPVRHGEWIKSRPSMSEFLVTFADCSECGFTTHLKFPYCPKCGAKME